jgi:hypothetical protein
MRSPKAFAEFVQSLKIQWFTSDLIERHFFRSALNLAISGTIVVTANSDRKNVVPSSKLGI